METNTSCEINPTSKTQTVGELVGADYRTADVFKKYGIDFCCGGKKSVEKSCTDAGVDYATVMTELLNIENAPAKPSQRYNEWKLDFLADYIVNTHHAYVRTALPLLIGYTQRVAERHGDTQPQLVEIAANFQTVADEMNTHMVKEEKMLFPYIKQLAVAQQNGTPGVRAPFGSVDNPIRMMEHEHETVGNAMHRIAELTNNFTPPANACTTFKVTFAKLQEFENDLHEHVHLENNVLFPRAIALEKASSN
ncbi:MAG TPA: iron-sulfur cluster repair di-iron protein [Chitinophagales bacterium]|nr:iron-sulfur cluster repair di-iron protein [Chitinophagales bacterium]